MTEPERPQVTVSDPGRPPAGADLLVTEEPRRRLPLWVAPLATGAVLAGLLVPPVAGSVRDDRRADRAARDLAQAQEEQRVRDDAVSVRLSDLRLGSSGDAATLQLAVTINSTGGPGVTVESLVLTGELVGGTRPLDETVLVDPAEAPPEVAASIPLDCAAVARSLTDGPGPTGVTVAVLATPRSGRQQQSAPLAVVDATLREALLDACQLGDPKVLPTAEVSAVQGDLLVETGVGRGVDASLLELRLPGVTLRPSSRLPFDLTRNASLINELEVVGVDCARLTDGPLVAVFRLVDGRTVEVTATPGDQPGSIPLADFLAQLRKTRCA